MSEQVEVKIESPEGLETHTFRFWVNGFDIILDVYICQTRETRRHKYKTVRCYERLKRNQYVAYTVLELDEVPFPAEIQKMALDEVISRLQVYKTKTFH